MFSTIPQPITAGISSLWDYCECRWFDWQEWEDCSSACNGNQVRQRMVWFTLVKTDVHTNFLHVPHMIWVMITKSAMLFVTMVAHQIHPFVIALLGIMAIAADLVSFIFTTVIILSFTVSNISCSI